jgi:hypothetical protein
MFVFSDSQAIFETYCVIILQIYPCTKFHKRLSSSSVVIVIKQSARNGFCMTTMLSSYYTKKFHNNSYIRFTDQLPNTALRP